MHTRLTRFSGRKALCRLSSSPGWATIGHRAAWPEGRLQGRGAAGRRASLPGVTSSMCADCGHEWGHHPGALLIRTCASCIHEEDTGRRDNADTCSRVTPGTEGLPARHWLVARHQHHWLTSDRVLVEGRNGQRWATLRLPRQSQEDVQRLLDRVLKDLAVMTLDEFDDEYRALRA